MPRLKERYFRGAKAGALGQAVWQLDRGLLTSKCACFTLGVYGRAKGTVRSKAEPWNESGA